jgi:hypothetical protein
MSGALDRGVDAAPGSAVGRVLGDTPRRLKLLTAGLAALGMLLGVVYAFGLLRDSASLANLKARTDGVSATSDLYYRLNDMDAMAANVLLVGYNPADPSIVPTAVNAEASDRVYESDRAAADADLEQIAQNPLLAAQADKLINALGSYEALIAQAFYIDKNALREQPAAPPTSALRLYTQASSLLHGTMLPASQQITDTDSAAVDASYSGDRSTTIEYGIAILVLGLVAASALFLGNRYHARMFRRRLGWLAPGVLVALMLGVIGLSTQLTAADHLHFAKQEAYDSINALERAQAISDDANADESRWLLEDRSSSSPLQASFFDKIVQVGGAPGVSGTQASAEPGSYYGALGTAVAALRLDLAADNVHDVTVTGYLGTELRNITFPGEAQAAYNTVAAFNTYVQDDATIRSDAESGNLGAAVAFDIGTQAGQSNHAFNAYMTDLSGVIQINDRYFASAITAGHGDLGVETWTLMIVGELLLLLFIGQAGYLRLREYR